MTVYLIDDHTLVAESVADYIRRQPGIKKVTTYTSAKVFLEKYNSHIDVPHVIITDLVMPDMDGMSFIKAFTDRNESAAKIIVLSSISDTQIVKQAFRNGVSAFVSKATPAEELMVAIHEVNHGTLYMSSNIKEGFLQNILSEEKIVYHLSPREKEVLEKVCSGLTIKEIAHQMNLSKHTVQSYHRLVMKKLKVSRTADLIVFAMQNGLYVPEIHKS